MEANHKYQNGVAQQPIPHPLVDDTATNESVQLSMQPVATVMSDIKPEYVSDADRHRPTIHASMTGSVGQNEFTSDKEVGHDVDLPERDDRYSLSTYEASKMFDEAHCRVSERTIIRWCNRNKQGVRRLDCAFDMNERKYYIREESVKSVIKEERQRGRQSELFEADLSGIEQASDSVDRHGNRNVGQRSTLSDLDVGHETEKVDAFNHATANQDAKGRGGSVKEDVKVDDLSRENMELKIELAKLEEQRMTKDEMMTILRQEIDRRGEVINQDRETYQKSLDWYQSQIEGKDRSIERLNAEMRGLLEAPKGHGQTAEPPVTGNAHPQSEAA